MTEGLPPGHGPSVIHDLRSLGVFAKFELEKKMRFSRLLPPILSFWFAILGPSEVFAQPKYAKITADAVNIRVGPSLSSQIVSRARKGDVFELHGKEGKWYRIRLFSATLRYVSRSLAEATSFVASPPGEVSVRQSIFRALMRAEDRAEAEADRKYPLEDGRGRLIPGNVRKNIDTMWLLADGYKLQAMHRLQVQPPIHDKIIGEGIRKNW
jgi:hypothetical protein